VACNPPATPRGDFPFCAISRRQGIGGRAAACGRLRAAAAASGEHGSDDRDFHAKIAVPRLAGVRDAARSAIHMSTSPAIAAPGAPILSVRDLSKRYAAATAVDGVSFQVQRNEIVGLLGPNGAGKTTTLNMIMGVLEPSSGSIAIEGIDLARERARALARTNFAAVYAPLPGNLTVVQNLTWFGLLYAVDRLRARIEAMLERFDLVRLRDTKCGVLSSGEQTRVCLAKAMLNEPTLLLLDEPTASLDPATAQDLRRTIRAIAAHGSGGILWTSHNMYEVEEVCDRVLFLSRGRILLEGDPRTLPLEHGVDSLEALFIALAREPLRAGAP
jgi:ABC-2 type transport system ATP-binding protein